MGVTKSPMGTQGVYRQQTEGTLDRQGIHWGFTGSRQWVLDRQQVLRGLTDSGQGVLDRQGVQWGVHMQQTGCTKSPRCPQGVHRQSSLLFLLKFLFCNKQRTGVLYLCLFQATHSTVILINLMIWLVSFSLTLPILIYQVREGVFNLKVSKN